MGACGSKPQDGTTAAPRPLPVLLGGCGDVLAESPKRAQHPVDRKWEWDLGVWERLWKPPQDVIKSWNVRGGKEVERLLKHVDLVDLRYVVELVEAGRPIPRWQDVPRGARIGRRDVHRIQMRERDLYGLNVLVLSYPWLDAGHPDKQLRTMRRLLPFLKAFLQRVQKCGDEQCTVGLMMDYMCLPQKRLDGTDDRTDEDKARFKQGLSTINQWYAHPYTNVVIFDVEMPDQSSGHSNLRPHSARGWCVFEKHASSFVKISSCFWSLRAYEAGGSKSEFGDAMRLPPQRPDDFAAFLRDRVNDGRLAFTAKADLDVVIDQYGKAFDAAFASAEFFDFSSQGWRDAEIWAVAAAIATARKRNTVLAVRLINVSFNQCTEVGLTLLLESLKGMDCGLLAIDVDVSEEGKVALKKAVEGTGVKMALERSELF